MAQVAAPRVREATMATPETAAAAASVSFSSKMWQVIAAIAFAGTGAAVGVTTVGAKAPPAIVVAESPTVAQVAELKTQVVAAKTDADRSRADIAQTLASIATVQQKQAETLSEVRASVARIEGRLETAAKRR